MLETFTPAVCGSRKRQIVAQALFTVAAVASCRRSRARARLRRKPRSARGRPCSPQPRSRFWRLPARPGSCASRCPQARRQVPERWRFELPLPVWATGYGAGLGAGFFTFQPVSTFWVACAGALALARPVPAALCLSLYGAGRAAMVVWPRRGGRRSDRCRRAADPPPQRSPARERRRPRRLRRPPRARADRRRRHARRRLGSRSELQRNRSRLRHPGRRRGRAAVLRARRRLSGQRLAACPLGEFLAYVDDQGIRVVRWHDGGARSPASAATALAPRPQLAQTSPSCGGTHDSRRLVVRNLVSGDTRLPATVPLSVDLGRPTLRAGRLAWHGARAASRGSSS